MVVPGSGTVEETMGALFGVFPAYERISTDST